MSIYLTDEIEVKTKKGKMGAAKQIFLEGDTQTVEKEIQDINSRHNTLNTKHESLSKTVQGIAATGGASTATNVTYDNTNSGMAAENIQDAVDKLAKEKADSSDVTKQLDKATIKDEDGTVVDTPFRYIQNEEFIFAKVDAEDKLLFGIQWDGTPKFGKTSEVEDELQEQITLLAERVAAIVGDEDITSTIDTLNELKTFFANIENTQSLTDILDNLDKTVIKDEEGNIQDTPFRVIESPEFFKVITDSEDRFLCGIQHDGSIEWSKGIPSPIRAKLQEIVSQIKSDKVELSKALATINGNYDDIKVHFKLNLRGKVVSILGDSLSTFADYIPTGNAVWYPNSNNDVKDVEQTWWMQFITEANAKLGINNSSSGAKVSGTENSSYIARVENLGSPDYIIIHGGTNDSWLGVNVGELHFDVEDAKLNTNEFADSYDLLIRKCKTLYPHANIILLVPHTVFTEYTTIIKEIAKYYNLFGLIDLHECTFTLLNGHYQVSDMTIVANKILSSTEIFVNKIALYEEGKSLIEDEVKECFRVISNDEFLWAVVDSEDRVLYGIYRDTGKPYYPLNEMYHVIQNEEYYAAWLDADDKVVLGIRRDGEIIGEIHAVNALKQVISQLQSDLVSLQEKVGTIDTNLKELLDVFSLQENPEYLAVEKDEEGKILSATNPDGSHYIHNAKSETIPTEFSRVEDPEARMEIIEDADGKVISYRDKNGTLHEEKINANHLELSETGISEFEKALKSHGFSASKGDWTDSTYIHIPEPECAFANIEGELPTEKGKTTKGTINFYDMQGNYFKKYVEIDVHGRTSAAFNKKNYTIDFYNDSNYNDSFTIKFGRWVSLDSFYFQGWYTDAFRGIDIVAYKLYQQIVSTRGYEKDKPYKYVYNKDSVSYGTETNTNASQNLGKNALCTPDGFPVILYLNGSFWGIYTVMLKKNRENFLMNKKDYSAIELDLDNGNIVKGIKDWSSFEIRNPKTLICMDGSKYNGDAPKELIDESSESYSGSNKDMKNSAITKHAIESLADAYNEVAAAISNSKTNEEIKAIIEAHYNVDFMIDYMIFSNLIENLDGWGGNWQWTTWNGIVWNPNPYDLNATFGLDPYGLFAKSPSTVFTSPSVTKYIYDYYKEDVKSRYASLRKDNIISTSNIIGLFKSWIERIGSDNYENEFKKWNATPSQRPSNINSEYWARNNYGINSYFYKYSASKTYKKNEYCFDSNNNIYFSLLDSNTGNSLDNEEAWKCMTFDKTKNYAIGDLSYMCNSICFEFKCLKPCIGIPPLSSLYDEKNGILGFYDSISRINKWVSERIQNLDNTLNYNM